MVDENKVADRLGEIFEEYLERLDIGYIIQEFLDRFDLESVLIKALSKKLDENYLHLKKLMKEQIKAILEDMKEK